MPREIRQRQAECYPGGTTTAPVNLKGDAAGKHRSVTPCLPVVCSAGAVTGGAGFRRHVAVCAVGRVDGIVQTQLARRPGHSSWLRAGLPRPPLLNGRLVAAGAHVSDRLSVKDKRAGRRSPFALRMGRSSACHSVAGGAIHAAETPEIKKLRATVDDGR